jgi:hypothetical protein
MQRRLPFPCLVFAAAAFALAPSGAAAQRSAASSSIAAAPASALARSTPAALSRPSPERVRQDSTQQICRGAPIPAGWILVNDARDPSRCGGDNPAALSILNVWVIEQLSTRKVNSTMDVCAVAPTPEGWTLVDVYRRNDRCGRPSDAFMVNIKRIRRVR